jgi:hypothetical protein
MRQQRDHRTDGEPARDDRHQHRDQRKRALRLAARASAPAARGLVHAGDFGAPANRPRGKMRARSSRSGRA